MTKPIPMNMPTMHNSPRLTSLILPLALGAGISCGADNKPAGDSQPTVNAGGQSSAPPVAQPSDSPSNPAEGAAAEASAGGAGTAPDPTGGAAATGGSGGQTNTGGTAGENHTGGTAGENNAGGAAGESSTGGTAGMGGSAQAGAGSSEDDTRPWFSFFTTSQAGLLSLTDDPDGFGGNLGGLAGADEICTTLARRANPGDAKTWRAFLSVEKGPDGNPVHAIDRIGQGPWYDFNNRLLAQDIDRLLPDLRGRPQEGDPQLAEMFTDENGDVATPDRFTVDNHDTLTGSDRRGRLRGETCADWTSSDRDRGTPWVGHSWPRSQNNGRNWISDHPTGGCGKGINTEPGGGPNGVPTVGAGGGYGGIYCFALSD